MVVVSASLPGASPTSMAMTKQTTVTMTAPLTVDTAP